ncbi:MAG: putative DNA binding domain-containing protein [Bifidobacteriaceae bacterium]|nr:putative DNA binding domain-containing protein [Bifidobacteriaceae bacterium]
MGIDFDPTLLPNGKLAAFESKTLEYKHDLSSPDRVMRALVAFANSAGGSIVIGVADDHRIIGVDDPFVEENRLANLVMNSIAPQLVPEIEIVAVDRKQLLVAKVYPAGQRPFHVIADGTAKGVYVRLGSSNVQADPWMIAALRRQSEGLWFDQLANHAAKAGLDEAAIAKAFPGRDIESAKQVLMLTTEDQGKVVPTNGGVLLFGHDRERLFPDAWVYCGRFRGADGLDLADTLELYANLLDIPDLVEAFLKKHAFKGADMREWRRKDDWSVPLDILREAVINALIHSEYTQHGGPIRLAFYDDHVYVESLGGLLPGMTVESMRAGMSRIRNQVIARAFRDAGMIEQWGYGVQRMFRRAAELGLDEPSYVELPGRLRFIVPTRHAAIMAGSPRSSQLSEETVDGASDALSNALSNALSTERAAALLRAARTPVSRADLLGAINLGNDSRNAANNIEPLIAAGLIAMTDPDNPRRRGQRYWTTDLGLAWAAEHTALTGDQ